VPRFALPVSGWDACVARGDVFGWGGGDGGVDRAQWGGEVDDAVAFEWVVAGGAGEAGGEYAVDWRGGSGGCEDGFVQHPAAGGAGVPGSE